MSSQPAAPDTDSTPAAAAQQPVTHSEPHPSRHNSGYSQHSRTHRARTLAPSPLSMPARRPEPDVTPPAWPDAIALVVDHSRPSIWGAADRNKLRRGLADAAALGVQLRADKTRYARGHGMACAVIALCRAETERTQLVFALPCDADLPVVQNLLDHAAEHGPRSTRRALARLDWTLTVTGQCVPSDLRPQLRELRGHAPVLLPAPPLYIGTDASATRNTRTEQCGGWACISHEGEYLAGTSRISNVLDLELSAICKALENWRTRDLHIRTDSLHAVQLLTGELPVDEQPWQRQQTVARIQQHLPGRAVTITWVRGHNGDPLNDAADRISRERRRAAEYQAAGTPLPERAVDQIAQQIADELRQRLTGGIPEVPAALTFRSIPPTPTLHLTAPAPQETGMHLATTGAHESINSADGDFVLPDGMTIAA